MILSKKNSTELFAEYPEEQAIICANLMSTFDLTKDGKQMAGVEEDVTDKDKMATKQRIIESMNQRTGQRCAWSSQKSCYIKFYAKRVTRLDK